jgi:protein-S-isoprenylcysteine O-methyltransferase Ste14
MPLKEHFESAGNWLFRWRSYFPLLLFIPILYALRGFAYPRGSHALDRWWELGCLAVSLAGVAIRAVTVGHAPYGTSGRNTQCQVAMRLNSTGMYSIVRHPLYLGNYFMWLGVALFPRDWWIAVIVSLVFWLYYERIMLAEEEHLRRTFGDVFVAWATRTPAFIPRPSLWTPPALPFSWRAVLKREYSGLFGLVASFTALELASESIVQRELYLDPLWSALFGTALVTYLVLLLLRKRTTLLNVEGR